MALTLGHYALIILSSFELCTLTFASRTATLYYSDARRADKSSGSSSHQ